MSAAADPATAQPAAESQQQPSPAVQSPAVPASGGLPPAMAATIQNDSLTCQWSNCGERLGSAEQLYDHVCERHVGRKSTNNLNLTCQWGNCRTTTVKRDHITSHIRVHVPLKPHKCDFCGKAFKRPQDLKKHVKTHADDSVLLRSPEPNRAQHGGNGGGYQPNGSKLVADLQALAATASGYNYSNDNMGGANGPYHGNSSSQAAAAFYGNAPQNSAYGNVYYAVNQHSLNSDYEIRKRAAYDALNEFFGEAKRRHIDPATYYDVGARLTGLSSIQLPVVSQSGYGGMSDYSSGGGAMVAAATAGPQHQYSLPLPNLRTKNDHLIIDQFLDQLQTTVYENSNHAAAAGVAQAGAHYVHPGVNIRASHSPPGLHASTVHTGSAHANQVAMTQAPSTDTPALTPASSVMSYTAGQSPGSVHSTQAASPTSRGSMYPTLPGVSAMSEMSGYPATSSAAPSALAPFAHDPRRRYSGSLLQKPAPESDSRPEDPMDTSEDNVSGKGSSGSRRSSNATEIQRLNIQSPGAALDPSLRSPSANSNNSADNNMSEAAQESWVENIRTIERLRSFIKEKLEQGDFEAESPTEESAAPEPSSDEQSLYPILKAVRDED